LNGDFVETVLSFPSLDTFLIDGRLVGTTRPTSSAFWWVISESGQMVDARARGQGAIEVALWYDDPSIVRRLTAQGVGAEVAEVSVLRSGANWQVHLRAPGVVIDGFCKLTGRPQPANYTLPQYTTVWNGAAFPSLFTVYTYAGHHFQACDADLAFYGDAPVAQAIRAAFGDTGAPHVRAEVEDGWFARAGVFRVSSVAK
jgi:hypothetical protein